MQTATKTKVKYNRAKRVWQTLNGKTRDFPAGPEGKRQAMLAALKHDHNQLYWHVFTLARTHGNEAGFVDRLIKAAQLVVKQQVYKTARGYAVQSQYESDKMHYIKETPSTPDSAYHLGCTCNDYTGGLMREAGQYKAGAPMTDYGFVACKHVLAALLVYFADVPIRSEPIPFEV